MSTDAGSTMTATDATAATTAAATTDAAAATTAAATTTQATTADASAAAATTTTTAAADTTTADWRSSITDPEHVEFAKRIASPADAVKVALDLRKANSAMIKVPGKDATAEDRAKFNKAIGVPETVEGYKFELGREPTEADKAIQGNLAKIALENGIPANAMTALSKAVSELATAQRDEANRVALKAREDSEASLRKEMGADYDGHVELSKRAVMQWGEGKPDFIQFLNKTVDGIKIGDHPDFVRVFGNIGRRMGEGGFIGAVGTDQRQSLQSELNDIYAKTPPGSDGYRAAAVQKRVMEINEALHGTGGIVGVGGRAF